MSAFDPLQTSGISGSLRLMRSLALGILAFALASCAAQDASVDICDVAQRPGDFVGREIAVEDIVIVEGHGNPRIVPASSCPKFMWFPIAVSELEAATSEWFKQQIMYLNSTNVNGNLAGVAGSYRVRVERQKEDGVVELSLLDAENMRIADAGDKSMSMINSMPPLPPDLK